MLAELLSIFEPSENLEQAFPTLLLALFDQFLVISKTMILQVLLSSSSECSNITISVQLVMILVVYFFLIILI
jgi:hypothetical protein